jgi:hypothetical protein
MQPLACLAQIDRLDNLGNTLPSGQQFYPDINHNLAAPRRSTSAPQDCLTATITAIMRGKYDLNLTLHIPSLPAAACAAGGELVRGSG